jgi:hypothetical protein
MAKVFGVGLGRTGISTLAWMLKNLGINTGHYIVDPTTYSRYDAIVDVPTYLYTLSINARWPNALYICTTREVESWLESMRIHMDVVNHAGLPDRDRLAIMASYGCLLYDEKKLRVMYDAHQSFIKWFGKTFAYDRMLLIDICDKNVSDEEKWKSLCTFLGKDTVKLSIPQLNKSTDAVRKTPPGMQMRPSAIEWIRANIPAGKTILELGSGNGTTAALCKDYQLYSVEHDMRWTNKYPSKYIHVPLGPDGWYFPEALKARLPKDYDLLIVDGPPASESRLNLIKYLDMFKSDVPVMFDDVERNVESVVLTHLLKTGYREIASDKGYPTREWAVVMR